MNFGATGASFSVNFVVTENTIVEVKLYRAKSSGKVYISTRDRITS